MDLVLPLKREFFEAIKAGTKLEDFRLRNDYWRRRLEGKTFERVIMTLGYPHRDDAARRIIVPWQGYRECQITHSLFGDEPVAVYAIRVAQPDDVMPPVGIRNRKPKCLRDPQFDFNMQGPCSAGQCQWPLCSPKGNDNG